MSGTTTELPEIVAVVPRWGVEADLSAGTVLHGEIAHVTDRNTLALLRSDLPPVLMATQEQFAAFQNNALMRSVKNYGAKGDGIADDDAVFLGLLAEGGVITVPDGTYRLGRGLVTNHVTTSALKLAAPGTQLILAPGAVLLFDNATLTTGCLVWLAADNTHLIGGTLRGPWDLANNGTDAVTGNGITGLLIRPNGAAAPNTISNISVSDCTITRFRGYGLRATADTVALYHNAAVKRVRFVENFRHWQFQTTVTAGAPRHCDLIACWFGASGAPLPTTKNGSLGGNAISTVGPFQSLRVLHNFVESCGRMAIEIWMNGPDVAAGHTPRDVLIQGNYFGPSVYRTFSVGGVGMRITQNTIIGTDQGWDYVEIGGDDITFHDNVVARSGMVLSAGAGPWTLGKVSITCNDMSDGPNSQVNYSITGARQLTFAANRVRFNHAVKAGFPKSAGIRVMGAQLLAFDDNRIELHAPCDREQAYDLTLIRGGSVKRNHAHFVGFGDGVIYSSQWFAGLEDCAISGNRNFSDTSFSLGQDITVVGVAGYSGLWQYKHDGAGFVITAANAAILNDPPGSPVDGTIYVVGDAPTGAWAGQPRCFAVWNGSAWAFTAWRDVFLYSTNAARGLVGDAGNLPLTGTAGDAYLLAEGGLIRCRIEDNDFSAGGRIRATSAGGVTWNFGNLGQYWQLIWQTDFTGNQDRIRVHLDYVTVDSSNVTLRPGRAPPSSGYHNIGTRQPNLRPAAAGYAGWICTSAGTPGTWKGYGQVEA